MMTARLEILHLEDDEPLARSMRRLLTGGYLLRALHALPDERYKGITLVTIVQVASVAGALTAWRAQDPPFRLVIADNQVNGTTRGVDFLVEIAPAATTTGLILNCSSATSLLPSILRSVVVPVDKPADGTTLFAAIDHVLSPHLDTILASSTSDAP